MSQQDFNIKIVLLGDAAVGKTTLISQYVNQDAENIKATIGAQYFCKNAMYNNQNFFFQVWDTAGAEKYSSLANLYYKDAQVAIIMYDITKRNSFDKLQKWVNELNVKGPENVIYAIVGNKIDLLEQQEVPLSTAMPYAQKLNAIFQETSAKENKGIAELFDKIAKQIYERQNLNQNQNNQQANQEQIPSKRPMGVRLENVEQQNSKKNSNSCC